MKKLIRIAVMSVVFTLAMLAQAADKKIMAGPKGGRLLDNQSPRAEFFVDKERKVVITFYDASLKPMPMEDQEISVIAEPKSGKVIIPMEKKDGVLISKTALPSGDGFNVVVLIKSKAGAKSQNFRIAYHDEICAECKRAEYACICGDAGKHDHDEKKK